jgi:hypothetical protein
MRCRNAFDIKDTNTYQNGRYSWYLCSIEQCDFKSLSSNTSIFAIVILL